MYVNIIPISWLTWSQIGLNRQLLPIKFQSRHHESRPMPSLLLAPPKMFRKTVLWLFAKQKIEIARDQLAGKEMATGRYYLQRKDYTGAINRFKVVVTKYQRTREVEEALMRLTEAYMALGIIDEAQTAAAVLGHNFPDSVWYKAAP